MPDFTIFPAIDLRHGQVVRLREGDPNRQTIFSNDPGEVAQHWLRQGAAWLHVVNLDAAFGEDDQANQASLRDILQTASGFGAKVQLGGGLRSLSVIQGAVDLGVSRVILGSAAIERQELVAEALAQYGPDQVAVGIDARDGTVRIRGWKEDSSIPALELGKTIAGMGIRWFIFTDVARDGVGLGLNLASTIALAQASGANVIASGGVHRAEDIRDACQAGLAGVIVGRALYDRRFSLSQWTYPNNLETEVI